MSKSTWKPNKLTGNPCGWQWDATHRIHEVLGIKNSTIPKGMHGTFKVDGWRVVVKRSQPGQRGTGKHRIFVESDGRLIPAGRVRQALCLRGLVKSRKAASSRRGEGGRFSEARRRR